MSSRACLRCISKKRRCDHERPVCGSCRKHAQACEYPPPQQRRGPVAGLTKLAETRVQQCENALWFLLSLPEVGAALERIHLEQGELALPSAPTSGLERTERAEWWTEYPLDSTSSLLRFLQQGHVMQAAGAQPQPTGTSEASSSSAGLSARSRIEEAHTIVVAQDLGYDEQAGSGSTTPNRPYGDVLDNDAQQPRNTFSHLWNLVSAAIPDEPCPVTRAAHAGQPPRPGASKECDERECFW
ncbi:hypothetical protein Q8F55_001169 [Vanrija albida]|uniref:Zn(2)-C6 fungal-type domain-containing protein n=1 Tax=Vanrija albida TaxID=181172 RepID=A0ABR3QG81_9TREE